MDLLNSSVSRSTAKTYQSANIAAVKTQNEMTQALVDMITENVDAAKAISASDKGQKVDVSI